LPPFAMVKRANEECGAATYPSGDSRDCHPYQIAKYKYKYKYKDTCLIRVLAHNEYDVMC
jgi:hypothetical protein